LRERLHDLDELATRLLHQLTGQSFITAHEHLPDNSIIVARTMGPAALLDYDRAKVRGVVLETVGASSHVAIVARALGIPAVGEVANIADVVEYGDAIILDGTTGDVHVRPPADIENAYAEKARLRARRQEQYQRLRDMPAVSRDGVRVDLHMNAGLLIDLQHVAETGAASIGLFRTELQFMVVSQFPRMREQEAFYRAAFEAVPDKLITFRTLDIGSDKVLPYMTKVEEENPALGWRAIRIGLDRPGLLRLQVRALLRAAAGRQLRIMFPMIATVEEFDTAKAFVEREIAYLKRHQHTLPQRLELGVMVEVPSLLWQLDEICKRVDFLSVGSNDLVQYLFAADRDNKRVASRFDVLSPPILRSLKMIVDKAREHKTPLSLCGEMGGKPIEALGLVALGFRELSMSPSSIGPVKAMLLATDIGATERFLFGLLDKNDGSHSLRGKMLEFAEAHGIPI
jgi:phosphotransferase system, enzyme I, PtsP